MKHAITLLSAFLTIFFLFTGCDKDDDNPVKVTEQPQGLTTYKPQGTITGLIKDRCTNEAIKGAVLSLSYNGVVKTTKSDDAGQFSFENVPAGQFKVISGAAVATGTYTITASLVEYNKGVADTTKKYRNYYYNTVTITFTSLVPGDSLGVDGLVGSVVFDISQLNSAIVGKVVDSKMQPVASARVVLYDQTITPGVVLKQTYTDNNGNYVFAGVDNGITVQIEARSADGKYQGSLPTPFSLPCNLYYDSLRSRVNAERIQLQWANDVAPYVIDITPQNNADVSPTNLSITYTFSVPIKQTPYTRTDLGIGHNTIVDDIIVNYVGMKKAEGQIPVTVSWNSSMTQLIITPANIVGSAKYAVNVTAALPKLMDEATLSVVNNTSLIGDFEVLNITTSGSSAVPGSVTLTRRIVPTIYEPLDYNGGVVGLEWTPDANARSYNLYRQIGDGPFELIKKDIYSLMDTNHIQSLVLPSSAQNPLSATTVKYQIRAVSKDLVEGPASNTVTIADDVRPKLINAVSNTISANRYQFKIRFSEPLALNTAENINNYQIQNPDTVIFSKEQAAYLGYNSLVNAFEVALTVSITNGDNLPAGFSIVATTAITDLANNLMSTTDNTYVYSAPPMPTLQSPNDGATNVTSSSNLVWRSANGATSYHVQIASDAAFNTIVFDKDKITSTSLSLSSVTGLVSGNTYYWRVQAVNSVGSSSFSVARSFTLQ